MEHFPVGIWPQGPGTHSASPRNEDGWERSSPGPSEVGARLGESAWKGEKEENKGSWHHI